MKESRLIYFYFNFLQILVTNETRQMRDAELETDLTNTNLQLLYTLGKKEKNCTLYLYFMSCYVHYLIHKYAITDYDTTFNKDVSHKKNVKWSLILNKTTELQVLIQNFKKV